MDGAAAALGASARRSTAIATEFLLVGALQERHDSITGWARWAENLRLSRFSAYFGRRTLSTQLVEQRLGILQIGGVEALGEPVVDLGEHPARFVASALLLPQSREADGSAQLQ
jgi:hypothetical protein